MGIFTNKATRLAQEAADKARGELAAERAGREADKSRYRKIQETLTAKIDILTHPSESVGNKGNDYPDYDAAVTAISTKYCNTAEWGCFHTKRIIDLRAAFILGEGIKVTHTTETKAEAERELQFAEDFLAYNGLESEMAQEIVKEAEIEGKVALKLKYDEDEYRDWPGMVTTRFISWSSKRYEVVADPGDYLWYKQLKWSPAGTSGAETLEEPQFVYKKFGGRINDPNNAVPPIANSLTQIDRLDKALYDLRRVNHLFHPTPDFKCEDKAEVEDLLDQMENINWKIGKAIVHTGEFTFVAPPMEGVTNITGEIETVAKMVAGGTGIPVHWLGLLDLLKNRATGDNTRELVMGATARERAIWVGAFEELLEKAMLMYNDLSGEGQKSTKLDPTRVSVSIPLISEEYWTRLEKVYIPAAVAGIISNEAVAAKFPDIDQEAEAERREEKEAKEEEKARADFEMAKAEMNLRNMGNEG